MHFSFTEFAILVLFNTQITKIIYIFNSLPIIIKKEDFALFFPFEKNTILVLDVLIKICTAVADPEGFRGGALEPHRRLQFLNIL